MNKLIYSPFIILFLIISSSSSPTSINASGGHAHAEVEGEEGKGQHRRHGEVVQQQMGDEHDQHNQHQSGNGQREMAITVLKSLFILVKKNPKYAWVAVMIEVNINICLERPMPKNDAIVLAKLNLTIIDDRSGPISVKCHLACVRLKKTGRRS